MVNQDVSGTAKVPGEEGRAEEDFVGTPAIDATLAPSSSGDAPAPVPVILRANVAPLIKEEVL